MRKIFSKIVFICLLLSGFLHPTILAQEISTPLPLICHEIEDSTIIEKIIEKIKSLPPSHPSNQLWIPAGQLTDLAEKMAEDIVSNAEEILKNFDQLVENYHMFSSLTTHCNTERYLVENVEKSGCKLGCKVWAIPWVLCLIQECKKDNSNPNVCPLEPMKKRKENIANLADAIEQAYSRIEWFFKGNLPSLNNWAECMLSELVCPRVSTKQLILDELEVARERISKCLIRGEDLLARARGEREGRFLISCSEALHSYIFDSCYGSATTALPYGWKNPLPPPCAEDYFCCK